MRYRALKLEVFGATPVTASAPSDVDVEEVRLAGYETGYQSGWDDATTEREKSDQLIAADLERNLRDISFTYAEARNEVLTAFIVDPVAIPARHRRRSRRSDCRCRACGADQRSGRGEV